MVLLIGNNAGIGKTLETTGIDTLLTICSTAAEADAAALA